MKTGLFIKIAQESFKDEFDNIVINKVAENKDDKEFPSRLFAATAGGSLGAPLGAAALELLAKAIMGKNVNLVKNRNAKLALNAIGLASGTFGGATAGYNIKKALEKKAEDQDSALHNILRGGTALGSGVVGGAIGGSSGLILGGAGGSLLGRLLRNSTYNNPRRAISKEMAATLLGAVIGSGAGIGGGVTAGTMLGHKLFGPEHRNDID